MSSKAALLKIGVPQRSFLDPNLFLIIINDLPQSFSDASFVLFADDATIAITGRTEREAQQRLEIG